MSDDTLLTRDEVSKWMLLECLDRATADRFLKTVDAAHGVLRDEMRAALKGQLEQLLAEKEKKIERLQGEATEQSSRLGKASRMVIETMKENGELKLKLLELEAMAELAIRDAQARVSETAADLEAERREHSRTRELLEQARQIGPLA